MMNAFGPSVLLGVLLVDDEFEVPPVAGVGAVKMGLAGVIAVPFLRRC
jgi:hypothetical protein